MSTVSIYFKRTCSVVGLALMAGVSLASCSGGGASGNAGIPTTSPTPTGPTTLSIVLKQAWTDSGLTVTSGESLLITATGSMDWLTGSPCILASGSCTTTPAGLPWATCQHEPPPAFAAPGLACWSLIGKIGTSGTAFEVGTRLQFVPQTAGELYLGNNDNYFPDDTGTWTTTITPQQ